MGLLSHGTLPIDTSLSSARTEPRSGKAGFHKKGDAGRVCGEIHVYECRSMDTVIGFYEARLPSMYVYMNICNVCMYIYIYSMYI